MAEQERTGNGIGIDWDGFYHLNVKYARISVLLLSLEEKNK